MTEMPLAREVAELVAEYCAQFLHPSRRFVVHDIQTRSGWEGAENSYKAGCYLIYSHNGELMYLGKASLKATMGSRLKGPSRSDDPKWSDAAFVQMIEVQEPFEAPSLEEYLLGKLATRHNIIGRQTDL